jgi:hypothetical protein
MKHTALIWIRNFLFIIQAAAFWMSYSDPQIFEAVGILGIPHLLLLIASPFMGASGPQIGNLFGEVIGFYMPLLIGLFLHWNTLPPKRIEGENSDADVENLPD